VPSKLRKLSAAFLLALLLETTCARAQAATTTWDGGGANTNWDTVANWSTDALPFTTDIVEFGSGFASGTTISLNGNRTADSLIINTASGFSITDSTLTLSTGNITRNDVAGTETDQTISSAIALGANGTWTIDGSGSLITTGVVSGEFTLAKAGAGTLTMNGNSANTFTGNTTVSAGTLAANADGALGATAKVTINAGGTVLLGSTGGDNRIGNTAEVALAGGTFNTGGYTETVGKMTLSADSTFDFGTGTSHFTYDGISSFGSSTLTILNWTGLNWGSGGTDQLLFSNSSFTAGSITSQVQFNIGGTLYNSIFLSAGANTLELVPVPEPATIFGASALVLVIGWRERKRAARLLRTLSRV